MKMQTISIDFPADILLALNESENEFKKHIKMEMAIRLYKSGKLTIGKAAQLSGCSRYEFENILSGNKIPISNLTVSDINDDIKKLSQ